MGRITLSTQQILYFDFLSKSFEWKNTSFSSNKPLNYWLHYKDSITNALRHENFNIKVLFNQYINNMWYRSVLIFVNNKPFIFAITSTAYPQNFYLHNLGTSSIGNILFKKNVLKDEFKFTQSLSLSYFLHKNLYLYLGLNSENYYGRKRNFYHNNKQLILQEYFLFT